jgi:hypothetical protein
MQSHTRLIELLVSLWFRAALASHKRVHARLGRAMASGQRGNFFKVRAPDTRPGLVGARSQKHVLQSDANVGTGTLAVTANLCA